MSDRKYLDYEGLKNYTVQFKSWITSKIEEKLAGLMHLKGTILNEQDIPSSPTVGDVYMSTGNFTYNNEAVEPGDLFIYTTLGWTVVQGNIDTSAIPTKISDLDNDANFITEADIDSISDAEVTDLFGA